MRSHCRFQIGFLPLAGVRCATLVCGCLLGIGCREAERSAALPDVRSTAGAVVETEIAPVRGTWPNWMGADHDGISREQGWSAEWPSAGLTQVWSRDIGIGFSSVALADNRLYTMGHVDGEEHVYALHAHTGETAWSYAYPCALVDNLHEGGPGATPTIDGEYVYTVGREGQLYCFRKTDGEVVWSQLLQEQLGVSLPEWGFTSSPFILGDQLILEAGRVVSFDKTNGKKLWQTERHVAGYGSAAVLQQESQTLLATLDCDGLRVVDAIDGAEIAFVAWQSPFRTNSTTPIVDQDRIFISTGYNVGCGLFRLVNGELERIYVNRDMRNHFNNSILFEGHLYGFDGNSNLGRVVQLKCMNLETGEVTWQQRGLGCGSLMVADGKLLILSEAGELIVAQATPEAYVELARSPFLEGRCWTVPVLLDGRVFGRNAVGRLVCAALP